MNRAPFSINLFLNIVGCLVLTGLSVYSSYSTASGLLSFPEWTAPLVFLTAVLFLVPSKFYTVHHTLLNLGVMILSGFLLMVPLPAEIAGTLKWWYPLGVGLLINCLVDLDPSTNKNAGSEE